MVPRPGNDASRNNGRKEMVTFGPVTPIHPAQRDLTIRYTLGSQVQEQPLNWVGIFRSGSRDTCDPVTCQWAAVRQVEKARSADRSVVFPAKLIQPLAEQNGSFQIFYVNENKQILGVSQPFIVTNCHDLPEESGLKSAAHLADAGDHRTANEGPGQYSSVSRELVTSEDEDEGWEMASRQELQESNLSPSDLSDIEILSTSPSKEAVKMKLSGVDDDDGGGGGDDVDDCDFEDISPADLLADHDEESPGSDIKNLKASAEGTSSPLYAHTMAADHQKPEVVEAKHVRDALDENKKFSEAVEIKQDNRDKTTKISKVASMNQQKLLKKSEKIINASISDPKDAQILSPASSEHEGDASVALNSCVRKRKRKHKTGKSKCALSGHHTLSTSESEPDIQDQINIKRVKKQHRCKMEESEPPSWNPLSVKSREIDECDDAGTFRKIDENVHCDEMGSHTTSGTIAVDFETSDQCMKVYSKTTKRFPENNSHQYRDCQTESLKSTFDFQTSDHGLLIYSKTSRGSNSENNGKEDTHSDLHGCQTLETSSAIGNNIDNVNSARYTEIPLSPRKMKNMSRRNCDENGKHEIPSVNVKYANSLKEAILNFQSVTNRGQYRKCQTTPLSLEHVSSPERIMLNAKSTRNTDVTRRWTIHEKLSPDDADSITTKNIFKSIKQKENICKVEFTEAAQKSVPNSKRGSNGNGNGMGIFTLCIPNDVAWSKKTQANTSFYDSITNTGDFSRSLDADSVKYTKTTSLDLGENRKITMKLYEQNAPDMVEIFTKNLDCQSDICEHGHRDGKVQLTGADIMEISTRKLGSQTGVSKHDDRDGRVQQTGADFVEISTRKLESQTGNCKHGDRDGKIQQTRADIVEISTRKLGSQADICKQGERDGVAQQTRAVTGGKCVIGEAGSESYVNRFSEEHISLKGTMASEVPTSCFLETTRKKCIHKNKAKTKRKMSVKQKPVKKSHGEVVSAPGGGQVTQPSHTSCGVKIDLPNVEQTTPSLEVADSGDLPPAGACQQERCTGNRETTIGVLNAHSHDATNDNPGVSCRQKSIYEVCQETLGFMNAGGLLADGSSVDAAPIGCQAGKESAFPRKVLKSSQDNFKAKYKYKGRISSCQQYLKGGDICRWRRLKRWLLVNKRRFKPLGTDTMSGDSDTLKKIVSAISATDSVHTCVFRRPRQLTLPRAPQKADLTMGILSKVLPQRITTRSVASAPTQ